MNKQIKFKTNLIFKRIFFITMLLIIFYIIFGFSSQNAEISGNISLKVTKFIVDRFATIKNMDNILRWQYINKLHPVIRKLAHFSIYSAVGFCTMGFWCTFNIKNKFKFLWSTLIGIIYACSDEFHQSFVIGRGPSIKDVGIDSVGIITGIFIMIFLIILLEALSNWFKK